MEKIELLFILIVITMIGLYIVFKLSNEQNNVDDPVDLINPIDLIHSDKEEKKKHKPREPKVERKVLLDEGNRQRDRVSQYSFKEYSLSSCQSRIYIKRVCDISRIELVDCWVEGINVNIKGNVVNISVNYKGNNADIYDVPTDIAREVVGVIGRYFQKNFLWNFRKLEGAFTKVINKHGNTDNDMNDIYLDEIILLQHKKVVYLFKQYKELIGVYIQNDRKITVDQIGNYLDNIERYITQKNV